MSTILAIDTASECFALAYSYSAGSTGVTAAAMEAEDGREHTRLLIPAIQRLLGPRLEDLAAILVVTGPGSYAGLRVGIATSQGLALARNIPVYGVAAHDAVAAAGPADVSFTAIHPIGRSEYAAQRYSSQTSRDGAIFVATAEGLAGQRLVGEGAGALGGQEVRPRSRCRAALQIREQEIRSGTLQPGAEAFYIREPHITRPRHRLELRTAP